MRQGQKDLADSERATWICLREWIVRMETQARGASSGRRSPRSNSRESSKPRAEAKVLKVDQIDRICDRLDELSAEWMRLEIGEALTVRWLE
jgi:hypothetical protein